MHVHGVMLDFYWTDKQNHIEEYNNNVNDLNIKNGSIYFYSKFTASEGAEGVGNFVLEGGFTADGASEQEFVESIERYEATGTLTAKAAEITLKLFSSYYNNR